MDLARLKPSLGDRERVRVDHVRYGVTTAKNFVLRFVYVAFACLPYSIRRTVDMLGQVESTGEYERSPVVKGQHADAVEGEVG